MSAVAVYSDAVQVGVPENAAVDVADAEALTARLRRALLGAAVAVEYAADLYAEAWERRADLILGYRTWDLYVADRLGSLAGLKIPDDVRRRMVATMIAAGMPKRKVGRAIGYSEGQVRLDLIAHRREIGAAPVEEDIVDAEVIDDTPPAPGPVTAVERVLAALTAAGPRGLTRVEAARLLPEIPDVGAVLSELHRYRRAGRLAAAEDTGTRTHEGRRFAVYLAVLDGWDKAAARLDLTDGRALEGPGRRSRRVAA